MSESHDTQPQPDRGGNVESYDADGSRHIVFVKRGQRFVFRYQPGEEAQLLDNIITMARDPESSFTMFDAAVLSHQMGKRLGSELQRLAKG